MAERDDLGRLRERKLEELAELGLPYLPNRFGPIRHAEEIKENVSSLEGERVCVAGRLMTIRLMGKAAFAHIQDATGQIQLYVKRDVVDDQKFEYFKLLDLGDIVGAEGKVFITRTGEVTVQVEDLVLLAKAFAPLPEKFHGLTDVETRYRQRYLDLIANEEARRTFRIRSAVIAAVRRYLDDRGFVEVETPILQPLYGGGAAVPFVTHYASLNMDAYLRIATELYLKRLIVGGLERVYEIGKDFRNEGFSRKHSPEFTMCELYEAYADYNDIMELTENMISSVAQTVLGKAVVPYGEHEVDLTPPWRRLTIRDALVEYAGIDIEQHLTASSLLDEARSRGIDVATGASRGEIVEELVSELVEPNLIQPTFLVDFPLDFPGSLLAKRKESDPNLAERFEAYAAGMELANAFTELNDPTDQRRRMEEAAAAAGESHHEVDRDFLQALEHGMPPTGGLGFGIDRTVMLLANAHHIRETILFPLLRPRDPADA
ncbi:MAG TPA: lysine--tRNA ligase [Chloroflexota bacterium]